MTPGARIAAVIELLDIIARAEMPADGAVESFLRARRYMGSKDRRSVTERIYRILRRQARLTWWLDRLGSDEDLSSRARVIADLALHKDEREAEFAGLFSGVGHAPAPLTDTETALTAALAGQPLDHPEMPDAVALEYPDRLDASLRRAFGAGLAREMRALNVPAPLDLRVNTLRATRDKAADALAAEGIETEPTALSPLGLRIDTRPNLRAARAFRDGLVEIQDEGSQIVAALTGARPGMAVVDFCAGAGGKTLALAAAMGDAGRINGILWACDVAERFLKRLDRRAERAGAAGIKHHVLTGDGDGWIAENAQAFDRVLVDAPCTGTGTWRRSPGEKWRLTPERLAEFTERQAEILEVAAGLLKPGGRLIYATCSVLPEENEDRVETFLGTHSEFRPLPIRDIWAETLNGPCPADGPVLRLSPAATETDGFFAAVFVRHSE